MCLKVFVLFWEYFRENVIIRGCVNKHVEALCGSFTYKKDRMKGCLLTCDEDFCNGQEKHTLQLAVALSFILLLISLFYFSDFELNWTFSNPCATLVTTI